MHFSVSAFDMLHNVKRIFTFMLFRGTYWKQALIASLMFIFGMAIFTGIHAQTIEGCSGGIVNYALDIIPNTVGMSSSCTTSNTQLRTLVGDQRSIRAVSTSTTNPSGSLTEDQYYGEYFRNGGAIGALMFGAGALNDIRPASTYDAVVYQARNTPLVSAQVTGFNQLSPITTLWGIFRNISLLLFVVVLIAIGLFILLQRRVGGQETVTLVSGLTNASVAIVVIIFSYAIGGLIIDVFINVMNGVVATTFDSFINSKEILANLNGTNSGTNILTLMSDLTGIGVSQSAQNLFQTALQGLSYPTTAVKNLFQNINYNVGFIPVGSAIGLFASTFVDILTGIISSAFNNSSLINAIVAFIIFIVMLRVVFALIGAYVSLIFKIMFAPFILLPAALPGNAGKTILGWIVSLIASALTFPGIFACILMSAMFLNLNANLTTDATTDCSYVSTLNPGNHSTIAGNVTKAKYFVVTRFNDGKLATGENAKCYPLVLPPKFNLWPAPLGTISGVEPDDLIRFVVALAFIVLTPSVPKILQQLLKVPQDTLLASAGAGFKSGAGAFSGFISAIPSFGLGKGIGAITRSAADSAG